jgi:hypothetical protein
LTILQFATILQRGRDHGLPDYNTVRAAYGLAKVTSFAQITSDPAVQAGLQSVYGDVNKIDPWVGALSEDHLAGSQVGPLITAGLVDQFTRARDGDRFWYLRDPDFSPSDLAYLNDVSLSDIIKWNTSITNLQANVFFMAVPEPGIMSLSIVTMVLLAPYRIRQRGPASERQFRRHTHKTLAAVRSQ